MRSTSLLGAALAALATGLLGCGVADDADVEDVGEATSPLLVAGPSSLAFGNVQVGTQLTKLVILTNTSGTDTETVTSATFTLTWSGAYTFAPAPPFSIAPGTAITTGVTFRPGTVGEMDTRLVLQHTAHGVVQSPVVVTITGAGVP
ncbi:MAG: hypothetical protein QM820_33165 [Minicystis sp.]